MYRAVAAPCASSLLLVKVTNTGDSRLVCSAHPMLKGSLQAQHRRLEFVTCFQFVWAMSSLLRPYTVVS